MPAISRIRFTNLVFENGAKRYNDVIFQFDSYNGVILLENGGGKTVLVQAVLQTVLPHTLLGERKAKDTFALENSPAHLAVEWLISDRPRRYALTAVTLFHSKQGMDSYKYVYEYESGDEHSLEGLPFVREGQNGQSRPSSKEEMADYYQYMSRNHLNAHYFTINREYQSYLEDNFKIINSEWKSVARINAAEGAVEGFFDGCNTTTQLVNQLLIPTVEEALAGGGTKDFVETFERQREHFKKHRQLRDKIEESQQVDMKINSYVNRYAFYDEARQALLKVKGEARSLYQLATQQQEQVAQRLEEHQQATSRLQEQRQEWERKQASYQLAGRRQELDYTGQIYEERRKEYEEQHEEYEQKNSRLQNLEISQLKARIRSSEEEIKYYTEQIRNLAADPDVRNLEEKIKNNAGYLRYCYLQEERILEGKKQESQTELDKVNRELRELERNHEEQQNHYYKLREQKGQAEQQRIQAENDMQSIASQILANPVQEEVLKEKPKWEQRVAELERNRLENQGLVRRLQEEKRQLLEELAQLRPQLQTCARQEQSLKDLNDRIQEEQESLLLRMKELQTELYSVHSLYTQQSTVINQFEDSVENLRLQKERAILHESQVLALHTFYESSSYYGADPLVEGWIDDWREQFTYLEAGAVYVEKAAQQLGHSVSEYFAVYPFWAISLVCKTSEADNLLARLRRQAMVLTHPVFILTQEEARSILDSLIEPSHEAPEVGRRVFPANWEVNLSLPAFQNWKQELEKKAHDASSERWHREARLQEMEEFRKQLLQFWEKYPYEEACQVQQSWQELREQVVELDQGIRNREERLEEIDTRLDSLIKKNNEISEEHTHLSNRIMKAQDYIRKVSERDKAELDLRQCQELMLTREQEMERTKRQKERGDRRQQELKEDLLLIQQEFRYLLDQPLYQEVKAAIPRESKQNRALLETERRDLVDALHQKQKGRQHLEDRLNQARIAKKDSEKDLERKRRQCDTEIDEDFIFPPGGDEEINVIIQQTKALKQLLKRLEPGLKQAETDYAIAKDRFNQQEADFYKKFTQAVVFSQSLIVVKDELEQEHQDIQSKQNYLDEQAIILKAEEDMFKQALVELERYHERYEYLQDNIVYVDLPSPVVQDFSYQPMPIIKRYIKELEDKQAHLNQVGEGLEQEKSRLEQFCQEELQDIKLRRMVVNGLKYLDNYQEVGEWKNRLSSRIALAIRHAEDDMREHDRQLQQFINHIHSYLLTMAGELRAIPRKTRVKVEDSWKEIFQFDVPQWEEKEGKSELRKHVDWMLNEIESDRYRDENGKENYALMQKDIEKWLQAPQLLSNVMQGKNIKVKCRKVTADGKVSSYPSAWESSNQWSGGEKWSKNMALFLGIQNYLAEKRQAINPRMKRSRTVILDNPFGKASSEHILDPVFFIAEQLGFQIIALTALAEGKFISDYFPIVYSCRLRPSINPDKYLIAADKEIRHAYFQDHDPEALRRLGEQKQMELF